MKKLLIATLVLIAAYAVGAAVFAVANGQADGKVLSEQKQLLLDGDMEESGTTEWGVGQSATLTKESGAAEDGNFVMRITYGGATNPRTFQNILTTGKTYRVTGWARSDGTQVPRVRPALVTVWTGTNSTDWQKFDVVFTAASVQLLFENEGNGGYVEFDDLVVTEYVGETTNADQQMILDGDMEASGTTGWNAGNNATLTKESNAAEDGARVLRAAYNGTSNPFASQVQVVGKTYRVTGWARGDGTAYPVFSDSGYITWAGTASTEWQRFDVVYKVAGGTQARFYAMTSSSGYTEWDDISITEYTAPTTDNELQLLADGDMEGADTSDWIGADAPETPVLTKESGGAEDGKRILRIARTTATSGYTTSTVLTIGKQYHVTGWARGDGSSYPRLDDKVNLLWQGASANTWQRIDQIFTAAGTNFRLGKGGAFIGYAEFDDIVITQF